MLQHYVSKWSWILMSFGFALLPILVRASINTGGTPVDGMSNLLLWSIIGGSALTYVAALINQVHWPSYIRFGTFFVFSLAYAIFDTWINRTLDWHNYTRTALIVVASGIVFYNLNKGAIKQFEVDTTISK